jgi:hypothetical protein
MVFKECYMDDQVSGVPQAGHKICTVEAKKYNLLWLDSLMEPRPPPCRGFEITLKTRHNWMISAGRVIVSSQRQLSDDST